MRFRGSKYLLRRYLDPYTRRSLYQEQTKICKDTWTNRTSPSESVENQLDEVPHFAPRKGAVDKPSVLQTSPEKGVLHLKHVAI